MKSKVILSSFHHQKDRNLVEKKQLLIAIIEVIKKVQQQSWHRTT